MPKFLALYTNIRWETIPQRDPADASMWNEAKKYSSCDLTPEYTWFPAQITKNEIDSASSPPIDHDEMLRTLDARRKGGA